MSSPTMVAARSTWRGTRMRRSVGNSARSFFSVSASAEADVLLVDTTGELRDWYALAAVVFVGKSLPGISEIGGQNVGEPAALGLPVVFGPHMENFAPLVAHLLQDTAAVQIATASDLPAALRILLADADARTALGTRARAALATHQGATARTAECIVVA